MKFAMRYAAKKSSAMKVASIAKKPAGVYESDESVTAAKDAAGLSLLYGCDVGMLRNSSELKPELAAWEVKCGESTFCSAPMDEEVLFGLWCFARGFAKPK